MQQEEKREIAKAKNKENNLNNLFNLKYMENQVKSTPKDVFLHLFNIVTFYLSIIGFITLYINYINALISDPFSYYFRSITTGVRWSSSILFIAIPAYILSSWLLARDLNKTPEKRELKLRKWLIYFTLFISAITIIIDLMIFVYNFLDGELTLRFFLKVLLVLLVAGAVFGYYIWELKRQDLKSKLPQILAIIVSVVVLASIIIGFFVIGTPAEQRRQRMDDQRIADLQIIQSQVIDYWMRKKVLPENLNALEDNISGFKVPLDPITKLSYEYQVLAELEFELCTIFSTSNKDFFEKTNREVYYGPAYYDSFQQNWDHDAGRNCFNRKIDPELYKTNELKPVVDR